MEAVAGAEGDGGKGYDGVIREQGEAEVLSDGGKGEGGLHEGEGVTDALARAEAEGK